MSAAVLFLQRIGHAPLPSMTWSENSVKTHRYVSTVTSKEEDKRKIWIYCMRKWLRRVTPLP